MLILIIFVRVMASTIGKPCNKIPFELFCRVCEDICNAKNDKKILILEKFISKCRGSIEKSENLNIVSRLLVLNKIPYSMYTLIENIIYVGRHILSSIEVTVTWVRQTKRSVWC